MQDYPNFFSFGFGADVTMAGYFDALPLEVKLAINAQAGETHSTADRRRFAPRFRALGSGRLTNAKRGGAGAPPLPFPQRGSGRPYGSVRKYSCSSKMLRGPL